ncbi:guanine nucleotide-binding protein-like 3 homolog [Culex quinquefasciatus]|nr:guanine nucleotide-binding protein-like 3 homolog [Culex quinquefasciatus]XP_039441574.1 guanine nucleotide-binding protein-like 3 homolog [Culex pipiens pallens]
MEPVPKMKKEDEDYVPDMDQASADEEDDDEDESAMEQEEMEGDEDEDDDDAESDVPGDYIEEEMLVFADFEKYLATEELIDPNVRVKVIGIETENPIVQINNDLYKGSYDFAIGTNVFLEEDPEGKAAIDPLYSPNPEKLYKYSGQSSKVLKMKRIFVTPKTEQPAATDVKVKPEPTDELEEPDEIDNATSKEKERYIVRQNYEEALNLHLPEGVYPPRHIDLEHNCEAIVRRTLTTLNMAESDMEDDPCGGDFKPVM